MKDLILFGIQGSGKGTQGKILSEQLPYVIFEAGGELRRLASEDSALGKKVKSIIDAGNLVPDEVIMEIVAHYVSQIPHTQAVIFDGIPRNQSQMKLFEQLMEKVCRKPWGLAIQLTEDEAMKRLTSRRLCSKCKKVFPASYADETCDNCGAQLVRRADDNPESIRVRLKNFTKETVPVIEWYREQGRLIEVDGTQGMGIVSAAIISQVQALE